MKSNTVLQICEGVPPGPARPGGARVGSPPAVAVPGGVRVRECLAMAPEPNGTRLYRGMSPEQRRADRRQRLLDAGLELFGTQGYAATSVRAVCEAADLNSRYFYESFSTREDLLYHLYLQVVSDIADRVNAAVAAADSLEEKARVGLRASWDAYTDDRRRARIIAIEVVGVSDRLERLRRDVRHGFAQRLSEQGLSFVRPGMRLRLDPVLVARALMGGTVETLADWVNGDCTATPDELVDQFTVLFAAAARASVERAPEDGTRSAGSPRHPRRPGPRRPGAGGRGPRAG